MSTLTEMMARAKARAEHGGDLRRTMRETRGGFPRHVIRGRLERQTNDDLRTLLDAAGCEIPTRSSGKPATKQMLVDRVLDVMERPDGRSERQAATRLHREFAGEVLGEMNACTPGDPLFEALVAGEAARIDAKIPANRPNRADLIEDRIVDLYADPDFLLVEGAWRCHPKGRATMAVSDPGHPYSHRAFLANDNHVQVVVLPSGQVAITHMTPTGEWQGDFPVLAVRSWRAVASEDEGLDLIQVLRSATRAAESEVVEDAFEQALGADLDEAEPEATFIDRDDEPPSPFGSEEPF